jgi:hypothetical protein
MIESITKTSPQELADQAYQLCLSIVDYIITVEQNNPYSKRLIKAYGHAFNRFIRRKNAYEYFIEY